MTVVVCPVCDHATVDPDVEWQAEGEPVEEVCTACEREWYGDEAGQP